MAAKPSLTIRRRLDAPPAQVYVAWTDPKQMVHWWGPESAEAHFAEADSRVGGRFRVKFRTPDGEEHDVRGIYRDVVPNRRLVFTWVWRTMPERESLLTVALQSEGKGTLLVLTHEQFFDEPARDRHEYGWNAALDKLERYLA
jgi:uncharacterized protein YndB with AHSA1/START domain